MNQTLSSYLPHQPRVGDTRRSNHSFVCKWPSWTLLWKLLLRSFHVTARAGGRSRGGSCAAPSGLALAISTPHMAARLASASASVPTGGSWAGKLQRRYRSGYALTLAIASRASRGSGWTAQRPAMQKRSDSQAF